MASRPHVCLVQMPFVRLEHPSIALGLLKAALAGTGIGARVVHANLLFAEEIGLDCYQMINGGSRADMNGEWCFAAVAFPDSVSSHSAYLRRAAESFLEVRGGEGERDRARTVAALIDEIQHAREVASVFVDRLAHEILAGGPKIVGCTSAFEQHVASLALLRRIRELDPTVVTLIGGANCEADMGVAAAREFPWLDVVFSGEADDVFATLCARLLERGRAITAAELPEGAINRELAEAISRGTAKRPVPRASVRDLERLPEPDYTDYFETLGRLRIAEFIRPGLHAETSRGCWWGAIRHCTFCGLNGGNMAYRKKSPARVTRELASLADRYGVRKFEMVDNILDLDGFDELIPALAEVAPPYSFFFETKANLKREQVALLKRAGVHWITPGIEAMHDELLALMEKGTTTFVNLQLLKYAREHGIVVSWNLLTGLPGEDDAWHLETAEWLPLVFHLSAPNLVRRVRFDRFSPYHTRPERWGIRLEPFDAYRDIYPVSEDALREIAYYFRERDDRRLDAANFREDDVERPGIAALQSCIDDWQHAQLRRSAALLCMDDDGTAISILDTRPCAPARRQRLEGLLAEVYRRCEPTIAVERLAAKLAEERRVSPGEVESAVRELADRRLILHRNGKALVLAVPGAIPERPITSDFAGGYTRQPSLERILEARRARLREQAEAEIEVPEGWSVAFSRTERQRYRNLIKA